MKFLRSKTGALVVAAVVLLALFVIRPGADRLRNRIARSVGLALGRPVEIGSVSLHLLPHPGFDLNNFVVHDDPEFSAEPLLRAQEVSAALRLGSLLRGRLEVSRLSLSEPSLNLVRKQSRWNLEGLVERAEKTPIAPTGKGRSEARPAFPYIEADHARINLKIGAEKKPYALTEADFSLWQDSDNAWGMRLKAQPLRTDFNLSDTGQLRVDGRWQRAVTLRETPVDFRWQWQGAQLGQASKLASGNDKGWRGTLTLSGAFRGTPADLNLSAAATIEDFRRYDVLGGAPLRLRTECTAHYSTVEHSLSEANCSAPIGDGTLSLKGSAVLVAELPGYDLELVAQDVPAQALATLLRHAKKNVPNDLIVEGVLDGSAKLSRNAGEAESHWQGEGVIKNVRLISQAQAADFELGRVPLSLIGASAGRKPAKSPSHPFTVVAETRLEVGPVPVPLAKHGATAVRGWVSRSGYDFGVTGDAELQPLFRFARMAGLPALHLTADGSAKVDLRMAGVWTGFAAPRVVGRAQLHSIHAELRGLNTPVQIGSADVNLSPDRINVTELKALMAGSSWRGTLEMPRGCTQGPDCPITFALQADEISAANLVAMLTPSAGKAPWYRFLSAAPQVTPYLATVWARGKFGTDRIEFSKLAANRVSADVELKNGSLRLSNLRAEVLGGKHTGEWSADFMAKPPAFVGSGTLERVALEQLPRASTDKRCTGSAEVAYKLSFSGATAAERSASAEGTVKLTLEDAMLPQLSFGGGNGPLQIRRLTAGMTLSSGRLTIEEGKLDTQGSIYQLSGNVTLERTLDLRALRPGSHGFSISGTLTEPRVQPFSTPEQQAALKP